MLLHLRFFNITLKAYVSKNRQIPGLGTKTLSGVQLNSTNGNCTNSISIKKWSNVPHCISSYFKWKGSNSVMYRALFDGSITSIIKYKFVSGQLTAIFWYFTLVYNFHSFLIQSRALRMPEVCSFVTNHHLNRNCIFRLVFKWIKQIWFIII